MSTTKTEQNIQKPTLPQSVVYNNLKQSIISAINQSGLPPWVLVDMLGNITAGIQNAAEQIQSAEMKKYSEQLEAYEESEKEKVTEQEGEIDVRRKNVPGEERPGNGNKRR